ncbi:ACP S-malonyltransferase [Paenalcaligenes hominis]|uniref:Malonyl CoA-acyl carrier protein transacylase n=1 Tax=Paenalcaligenes hominis TaxID=643674 RepID=A0ABX0WKT2_9BURK|nr:ACP S-malonyltransferase [Paenalcaligenes hominis]NJB63849.1 [acyl-carrier-protein] S-malonyltransferase [Paenalcaligenes hominis]GGE61096.1 malonyl CoA-acyl carrier protein transacylase [Paenalcaligenes hominis]
MKKIAFVFPGQGSQSVGMLDAWSDNRAVQAAIQVANEALDQDLGRLIATGPDTDLNLTTNTQPAMLLAAVAMFNAWVEAGGALPDVVAGHSLGEYSALTASGVLRLSDAVKLVRIRADAMQQAVPVGVGAMAAVLNLNDEQIRQVCAQAAQDQVVEPVNFNAPGQIVIAGHKEAVERACELAKVAGARRAVLLPVSAPFHSSLLAPAADTLAVALNHIELDAPRIPVINNVDVAYPDEVDAIKSALARQAWHPVRWVETIEKMRALGVTHIVECGPGKVLSGLVKRIDKDMIVLSINDPASLEHVLTSLQN